ncbi:MAG: EI24 domain-containing protein [Lautropia sp.]
MGSVVAALGRGIASQLTPRMLALLIVPFLVAIGFWIVSAWLLWDPVTLWFQAVLFQGDGWMARGYRWLSQYGLAGLKVWLPNLFALLLLVPIAIASALALIALLAMPMVVRLLGNGPYADVERRGSLAIAPNLWNVAKSLLQFAVGYLLTLPLWLIPPLALVIPWFWWGWLTARLMRFDSLVEHASVAERRELIHDDRRRYLLLGLATAALNYIPPLFLIAPVLSALVFAHYSLARLREFRRVTEMPRQLAG